MGNKLTVIVPCKNESDNIRACIESFRAIADEILVADSGSTDGTLDIVRKMGDCRIVEREYRFSGDFKNWAIPQAQHEWVLLVDADERVTPQLADEIQALLDRGPDQDAYWIYRKNHFMGHPLRFGPWSSDKCVRLFRRELRYLGDTDHAEIHVPNGKLAAIKARLTHYTFWTYDQYFPKIDRYASFQAQQWHKAGRTPSRVKILFNFPCRFLHNYFIRLGFLDGWVGFQVCMMVSIYSFLKQARHWELCYALSQAEVEVSANSQAHPTTHDTVSRPAA
jgi:glycosyltransferase involved in cell wall biosynthesis